MNAHLQHSIVNKYSAIARVYAKMHFVSGPIKITVMHSNYEYYLKKNISLCRRLAPIHTCLMRLQFSG